VFSYATKHYASSLPLLLLRKVAKHLGLRITSATPHIELFESLISRHCRSLSDDDVSGALESVRASIAKKAERRKSEGTSQDDDPDAPARADDAGFRDELGCDTDSEARGSPIKTSQPRGYTKLIISFRARFVWNPFAKLAHRLLICPLSEEVLRSSDPIYIMYVRV
jgi:hypothetical protein